MFTHPPRCPCAARSEDVCWPRRSHWEQDAQGRWQEVSTEGCCASRHLGNYIARLQGLSRCEDITQSDVDAIVARLERCASRYYDEQLGYANNDREVVTRWRQNSTLASIQYAECEAEHGDACDEDDYQGWESYSYTLDECELASWAYDALHALVRSPPHAARSARASRPLPKLHPCYIVPQVDSRYQNPAYAGSAQHEAPQFVQMLLPVNRWRGEGAGESFLDGMHFDFLQQRLHSSFGGGKLTAYDNMDKFSLCTQGCCTAIVATARALI